MSLALISALGAIYVGLGYVATASDHPPLIALIIGLFPLAAVALVVAWKSRLRALSLLLWAVGALTVILNFDNLRDHAAWVYFVQHAGAMIILGATFGNTLTDEHADALCSRIASVVLHTDVDAKYLAYTWKVTLAWTIFFAAAALLSVLLFFFGPIEVWSIFANLLTPLLLGAMFAGEYLIRIRALPDRAHFNIVETIRAYRNYSQR